MACGGEGGWTTGARGDATISETAKGSGWEGGSESGWMEVEGGMEGKDASSREEGRGAGDGIPPA